MLAAAIAFALCAAGCGSNQATESSPEASIESNEASGEEYESKLVELKGVVLRVPAGWREDQSANSLTLYGGDNKVSIQMYTMPVEGAPDHPLAVANSAKYMFTSFCESNEYPASFELEYESVNGFPCYYTTNNRWERWDSDGASIYSDIYVIGFNGYGVYIMVLYDEQEEGLVSAIMSTLNTSEPAPDRLAYTSSYLTAEANPADLYNMQQQIIAEAEARVQAEKNRLSTLEPSIGMTEYEVRNSAWGKPEDINTTITKYGTHEQWVYSHGRYVYLDDGVVSAVQQ